MIYFKIEWEGHPADKMKALKQGTKEGVEATALFWHGTYAKQHFWPSATQRYGYQQRTDRYIARKSRRFGHRNPLVWTGRSKRDILRYMRVTSTATASTKRATGYVFPPVYFWKYAKGAPNKGKELFTTLPAEERKMYAVVMKAIRARLRAADRVRRSEIVQ